MRLTVVTPEQPRPDEARLVSALLEAGIVRINVRHPALSLDGMRRLLDSFDPAVLPYLSLHDCHELAAEYGTGIHLNSRHPHVPVGFAGTIGRSCHTLTEAAAATDAGYYFISPVFASISKAGYTPSLTVDDLHLAFRRGLLDSRAVALGGVTAQHLPVLRDIGFTGAAISGYLWGAPSEEEFFTRLNALCSNS